MHLLARGGCSRTVKINQGHGTHANIGGGGKKAKKRRITESTVTPTLSAFRRCELDTVAGWGWRIFLWEGVVQGRSKSGVIARQYENSEKGNKRAKH